MDDRDDRRASPAGRAVAKVIRGGGESSAPAAPVEAAERPVRAARPGKINSEDYEALTSAQRIIEDAKKSAQEIIEQGHAEKERIFEEARKEARAEVQAQAAGELAKAKLQAGQMIASAQDEIIALASKVAEKIIGHDLERDPDVIADICATAIEHVRNARAMVLRVHPRDGASLRKNRPNLMELVGRTIDLSIKDDPDVELGGCIIQTEFGTVDAQLKTQFEMLKNVLSPDAGKSLPSVDVPAAAPPARRGAPVKAAKDEDEEVDEVEIDQDELDEIDAAAEMDDENLAETDED